MIDSRNSHCSQGLSICSVFSAIRSDLLLWLRSISLPGAAHTACICFSSAIILTFQLEIMKLSCYIQHVNSNPWICSATSGQSSSKLFLSKSALLCQAKELTYACYLPWQLLLLASGPDIVQVV
jgi:hypothetical protein